MTRFALLRHAWTDWNQEKKIQGRTDIPLSEQGTKQARIWKSYIEHQNPDRILCSDLIRAQQTAFITNERLKLPIELDARLREQDWGDWEGLTLKEVQAQHPALLAEQIARGWNFCPPEGESRIAVLERSRQALVQAATNWPNETILVVTHGGVLKSLIYDHWKDQPRRIHPKAIKPEHLHFFIIDGENCELDVNAIDLSV